MTLTGHRPRCWEKLALLPVLPVRDDSRGNNRRLRHCESFMERCHTAVPDEWKGSKRIATPVGCEILVVTEEGLYFSRSDKPPLCYSRDGLWGIQPVKNLFRIFIPRSFPIYSPSIPLFEPINTRVWNEGNVGNGISEQFLNRV